MTKGFPGATPLRLGSCVCLLVGCATARGVPGEVAAPRAVRDAAPYAYRAWGAPDTAAPRATELRRQQVLALLDSALRQPLGAGRAGLLLDARRIVDSLPPRDLTAAASLARSAALVEWARHLARESLDAPSCAAARRARVAADSASGALTLCDIGPCPPDRGRLSHLAFSAVLVAHAQVKATCDAPAPGAI